METVEEGGEVGWNAVLDDALACVGKGIFPCGG